MINGIVFAGPSMDVAVDLIGLDRVQLAPPVRCGDILIAISMRPKYIAIIDGLFGSEPSVWHKEILLAISKGISIYGCSSMGALRAAELHSEGMIGVGKVFEWYRDGVIEADDEVALVHGPRALNYKSLSYALVDVRFAFEQAMERGDLTSAQARSVLDLHRQRFYPTRVQRTLDQDMDACGVPPVCRERILDALRGPSIKRLDAQKLISHIAGVQELLEAPKVSDDTEAQLPLLTSGVRRLIGRLVASGRPLVPDQAEASSEYVDSRVLRCWPRLYLIASITSRMLCLSNMPWHSGMPGKEGTDKRLENTLRLYIDLQLSQAFDEWWRTSPQISNAQIIEDDALQMSTSMLNSLFARYADSTPPLALKKDAVRVVDAMYGLAKSLDVDTLGALLSRYALSIRELPEVLRSIARIEHTIMSLVAPMRWAPSLDISWWSEANRFLQLGTRIQDSDKSAIEGNRARLSDLCRSEFHLVRFGFDQGARDLLDIENP